MKIAVDTGASLFIRDEASGRLVFNLEAIENLGLSPAKLIQRGYALSDKMATAGPADKIVALIAND